MCERKKKRDKDCARARAHTHTQGYTYNITITSKYYLDVLCGDLTTVTFFFTIRYRWNLPSDTRLSKMRCAYLLTSFSKHSIITPFFSYLSTTDIQTKPFSFVNISITDNNGGMMRSSYANSLPMTISKRSSSFVGFPSVSRIHFLLSLIHI